MAFGKKTIDQIDKQLLQLQKKDKLALGFYIVSKCVHGHEHNNRVMMDKTDSGELGIEIICPHLGMFYKEIEFSQFKKVFSSPAEIVNNPEGLGFEPQEM